VRNQESKVEKNATTALREYKKAHGSSRKLTGRVDGQVKKQLTRVKQSIERDLVSFVELKDTPPKRFKSEHNLSKSKRAYYINGVMQS
jgi:hypothetical protein